MRRRDANGNREWHHWPTAENSRWQISHGLTNSRKLEVSSRKPPRTPERIFFVNFKTETGIWTGSNIGTKTGTKTATKTATKTVRKTVRAFARQLQVWTWHSFSYEIRSGFRCAAFRFQKMFSRHHNCEKTTFQIQNSHRNPLWEKRTTILELL